MSMQWRNVFSARRHNQHSKPAPITIYGRRQIYREAPNKHQQTRHSFFVTIGNDKALLLARPCSIGEHVSH